MNHPLIPDDQRPTVSREQLIDEMGSRLAVEQESNLLLAEALADLQQLAAEDTGWQQMAGQLSREFTPEGRRQIADICRMMAISNPLIKGGLNKRIGYIWGQGVTIKARAAGEDAAQDVDAVVQAFISDNTRSLFGSQAHEELERALGTDGEVYLAAFTNPLTGEVQVRSTPTHEVVDAITNPEDRDDPWFYVRRYAARTVEASELFPGSTATKTKTVTVVHPALGFHPTRRPKTLNGDPILWDAPILHIPVNRLDGWTHGVPDVYAAVAWARLYKEFLVDWAGLTKALAKFAWRATGDSRGKAAAMAARARQQAGATGGGVPAPPPVGATGVGQMAAMGPGQSLEAIPKSGAHIDADSGKPLAAMVAAGLGVPVTILLADPGVTGARATAETLDIPTALEMGMRRLLWQDKLTELFDYVIDQAVITPQGALDGRVYRDTWDRRRVELGDQAERTIEWDWPPMIDLDPIQLVKAIVEADGTGKMPPLTTLRLLLTVLGVKHPEEIIELVTDDAGNWVDPEASQGQAAADRARRGEDPAEVL